jgi:hypothetical protein
MATVSIGNLTSLDKWWRQSVSTSKIIKDRISIFISRIFRNTNFAMLPEYCTALYRRKRKVGIRLPARIYEMTIVDERQ